MKAGATIIAFVAGMCLFLMSRYADAIDHDFTFRAGDEIAQAFKENTRLPVGLWVVVLATALFVLSAVSIHFSRRFDPLYEDVEPYRRRVAATIFETVQPGDELTGTLVVMNSFRMDGVQYNAYELEFDDIADAPLYVNIGDQRAGRRCCAGRRGPACTETGGP